MEWLVLKSFSQGEESKFIMLNCLLELFSADACKKSYTDADYAFARRDYVCAGSDGKDVNQVIFETAFKFH